MRLHPAYTSADPECSKCVDAVQLKLRFPELNLDSFDTIAFQDTARAADFSAAAAAAASNLALLRSPCRGSSNSTTNGLKTGTLTQLFVSALTLLLPFAQFNARTFSSFSYLSKLSCLWLACCFLGVFPYSVYNIK